MSSLRNAVKRITHKERSQPQARAHLGILEKKKDYKQRAVNYHRKEDRIKAMQRKASMRNPDEFYFGMHNAQIRGGSHQKTQEAIQKELEDQIGAEAVRVMKDQDLNYVRLQKQRDMKKAEKLKESLHFLGTNSGYKGAKHTIFVDSKEEADNFDPAKHFDTAPELVDRAFNRPRKSKLRAAALQQLGYGQDGELDPHDEHLTEEDLKWQEKMARKAARAAAKDRSNAYGELEARAKRAAAMEVAEAHLQTEKLLAGKGRKRKIKAAENGKPAQYKWRRKRKR
jgi:U3 small nucleolar RNA-associated protein 11